jgi:type IV pilus assembly protein PilY1
VANVTVANQRPQTFYALSDPNTGGTSDQIAGRANLTQQTITIEVKDLAAASLTDRRVTSNNVPAANSRGWYLDLRSPNGYEGEMQVTDSLIRNGHVVFTTLVPTADPCDNGGSSWLMELNLFTGARLAKTPFDLNNNQLFDDFLTRAGQADQIVSGIRTAVGITPKPAPLSGEKCDYLIFPGTSGGTETRCRDPGPRGFGRQSWRQAQ